MAPMAEAERKAFRLDRESAHQENVKKLAYNVDVSTSVGSAAKDSWTDNLLQGSWRF